MKAETSLSYDAGLYRRLGKTFDLRVAANYINTSNYFVHNTASTYYNGAYAYQIKELTFYGAEFEFNWKPMEKLVLFGNYSYLNSEYKIPANLPYPMLLNLPPKNKGKISARYTLPFKTRMAADIGIYGKRKTEGGFILDRYATADVSLERSFSGWTTASFFVNNLTGTDYQQVYGFPAPGVTWGMRLKISLAKDAEKP